MNLVLEFVIVFTAVLSALWVFNIPKKLTEPIETIDLPSPEDATRRDLSRAIEVISKRISMDLKGTSFPIKVSLEFEPFESGWAGDEIAREIICANLERKGWVVEFTDKPNELLLDVPRKKP